MIKSSRRSLWNCFRAPKQHLGPFRTPTEQGPVRVVSAHIGTTGLKPSVLKAGSTLPQRTAKLPAKAQASKASGEENENATAFELPPYSEASSSAAPQEPSAPTYALFSIVPGVAFGSEEDKLAEQLQKSGGAPFSFSGDRQAVVDAFKVYARDDLWRINEGTLLDRKTSIPEKQPQINHKTAHQLRALFVQARAEVSDAELLARVAASLVQHHLANIVEDPGLQQALLASMLATFDVHHEPPVQQAFLRECQSLRDDISDPLKASKRSPKSPLSDAVIREMRATLSLARAPDRVDQEEVLQRHFAACRKAAGELIASMPMLRDAKISPRLQLMKAAQTKMSGYPVGLQTGER